jgi:hypothetical protein
MSRAFQPSAGGCNSEDDPEAFFNSLLASTPGAMLTDPYAGAIAAGGAYNSSGGCGGNAASSTPLVSTAARGLVTSISSMHRLVLGGSSAQSLGEPFSTDSPAVAGAGADEAVGGSGGDVLMRHQGTTESGRAAAVAAAVAAAEAVATAAEEATAKKNARANSVEIKRRPRTSAAKYEKVRRDQMKARVEALREAIGDSAADLDKSNLIAHAGEHILEQRANVAELGHKLSLAVALQARLQHQVDQLTRELEAGGTGRLDPFIGLS